MHNILNINSRGEFREWLLVNAGSQAECWVPVKRGRPADDNCLYYLDAVEEALCFGWIDSVMKSIDGVTMQRFSPRRKNSPWTELNKERCRRLEKLGLMTQAGMDALPEMDVARFEVDPEVFAALKEAGVWDNFTQFPPLYQRIRAYNVAFSKKRHPEEYEKALARLIEQTRQGKLYGDWNDYGRLLDY